MLGLRASRAQYKRMEWNLPLKKDICLTQAFRSHFLLKEDRKKLKVEKEGSDVYEQNEPQIEKADQGEIPLSIGVLRWERKEGFPAAQQFFHTNLAARRCYWHNNRYTIGWPNPVLSY
ncbi:unnamed protein product [Lactuca saligna]|uniref:Uncharacterized protein n=1 Tax=Lactuca saligna TaxID=75948 RepID=A0AA35UU56_LACSI|nr:unnamed protein product [Lactuca saligna]